MEIRKEVQTISPARTRKGIKKQDSGFEYVLIIFTPK
jgi:hypothetical protein